MPKIFMIAGPNGVGKTTSAIMLLPEVLHFCEYVNADSIAAGLSPFKPEETAFKAGRLMLERIHYLASEKKDFAFETTAASKSFFPFLKKCKKNGYEVNILFLWIKTPELTLKRIADRVALGGHNIPENIVRRRYKKCLYNFFKIYKDIASSWFFYDNSDKLLRPIAENNSNNLLIFDKVIWEKCLKVINENQKT